jgi:hypothetical protein
MAPFTDSQYTLVILGVSWSYNPICVELYVELSGGFYRDHTCSAFGQTVRVLDLPRIRKKKNRSLPPFSSEACILRRMKPAICRRATLAHREKTPQLTGRNFSEYEMTTINYAYAIV